MRADLYLKRLREASKRELLGVVMELARRCYDAELREPVSVSAPGEAFLLVREIGRAKQEQLVGLYLDAQNKLIAKRTIAVGGLNVARSVPREILYPAVQHLACGFILAHNHPSGNPEPSAEDVEFTRRVAQAGELLGIELYDHLIVTRDGFTSIRERGVL